MVGKNTNDVSRVKEVGEILDDDLILDIGPNTINTIRKIIDKSKTVLWNGPAGYFENPNFAKGSKEIARAIIKKRGWVNILCCRRWRYYIFNKSNQCIKRF